MSTKDSEALEQQRQRRNRINRMKTGIIVTITVWMLVSLLAIILLTVQVARLSSHVKRLEKAGQTTVSQNIPDSENVQAADILQALAFAEDEADVPEIPQEWWEEIGKLYSEQLATTAPISPCHGAIPSAAIAVKASISGTLPI